MRVISQGGKIDVPYENFVFSILNRGGGNFGIVAVKNVAEPPEVFLNSLIATYSTEAKAIKAMEMCRKHYATAEYNRRIIPKGDTLVDMEIAKELLASGFIFQFPQDDEIEV